MMRISGPGSATTLIALTGRPTPEPRTAVLRRLCDKQGEPIDQALVLWMPGPGSFTGEDCVELHLHGGSAVVMSMTGALLDTGLRMAEPGEFTRRAFENGRLDLVQAEAIADLVEAESGAQRRQALAQLGGALSRRYEAWRDALLDALSLLEAEIDFPDEDVPGAAGAMALPGLRRVHAELQAAAVDLHGEKVREGFRIAIVGAPNVGKSSLLNALIRRDAAIVTSIAGTTRDVVEVPLSLGGQTLILADTAGLRTSRDPIEAEGVRRARAAAADADLRIGVMDVARPETGLAVSGLLQPEDILVLNKADLPAPAQPTSIVGPYRRVTTVAATGDVGSLQTALGTWLEGQARGRVCPATTRLRHRLLLGEARDHLARVLSDSPAAAELGAESVRLAIRALERVTGRSDPEAVLDRVFASFCIGK